MKSSGDESARNRRLAELASIDELDITVEKLVAGGDGLGRFKGIPIFVPRAAPGDRLRIRISERRPQYARGEIVEIIEPGAARREPPCAHFARCGGCALQHVEDHLQTEYKVAAARETLVRIGGLSLPGDEEVVHGKAWGYRLRTQLHIDSETGAGPGYYARSSHDLVTVRECPVLTPELESFVVGLSGQMAPGSPRRLDVTCGDGGSITCAPTLEGLPRGEVKMRIGTDVYHYDARAFFQGHRGLLEDLIRCVVGNAGGNTAWDLYAGVGLFSIPLARRYDNVVAVEGDRVAVRYLRKNARVARIDGIEAVTGSVEHAVKNMPAGVDRIVADPPRAGLGFRVRASLYDLAVPHLTYVSCHPAVLARDLKHLSRVYELRSLTYLDLFPQTGHLEVVAQLAVRG